MYINRERYMKKSFIFLFITTTTIIITSIFTPSSSLAAAADISLGSTLSASDSNSKWTSPNNTFTFTFITQHQLQPTSTSTTTNTIAAAYYAAILYDNSIPIWVAGCATDSSATLQLSLDGNLILRNGTTNSLVWQSDTAGFSISTATLDDSGNFILKNDTVPNIWSTFSNPTDTIVPTQNFTVNNTLLSGLYSFKLLDDGNLTLLWNDTIVYYNSVFNTSVNINLSKPSLSISSTGILSLFYRRLSRSLDLVYGSDYGEQGDILRFVKLDSDGNLRMYSYARGSGTTNATWSAVSDQCKVFGYCGNNGICRYNNTSPVCGCASENFEFVDPRDSRKGCRRKVEIKDCLENLTMLKLDHAVFLTYYPQTITQNTQIYTMAITPCRGNCLTSSACVASTALVDGTGTCFLKSGEVTNFVSGYQSPALPSTSYMKICSPEMPYPSTGSSGGKKKTGWRLKAWVLVVIILVSIFGLIALQSGLCWWCSQNGPNFGGLSAQYMLLEYASSALVQLSYKELLQATNEFREKLGEGGFGAVYRGVLANRIVVAVKQLEGIEQGERQFRTEVNTISSTHHLNLVRLIGFCSEGRHRLLVYEFMKNGSLDTFLFSEGMPIKLMNWEYRYKIALGTARGIAYLHEECQDCIIHCDIKPENILLDENYNAKVSDFGLAKLINPVDHRHRSLIGVRGTRGYLAPEWLANLPTTSKSDVYSYGMVLLEIVSGKRNFEVSDETNQKKFSVWAYAQYENGNAEAIIDKRLFSHVIDMEQVMRAIQVSFLCIQGQPSQRPMMSKVVQMLEGITKIEKPPTPNLTTEWSSGKTSITALSAFTAAAAPALSSTSSFEIAEVSSSASTKNVERASSSLLMS